MLWFLTLTDKCNLRCIYCGGGDEIDPDIEDADDFVKNDGFTFDISKLAFLQTYAENSKDDPEGMIICFYGGEPLLRIDEIKAVMDMIPSARFVLQTNGTLLNKLNSDVLDRLSCILVSIDGRKELTDMYRGAGTYNRVISSVKRIREKERYKGEIIARMTVTIDTEIYDEVTHLLNLDGIDYVHWQLDCQWDSSEEKVQKFALWRDVSYNPGISALMKDFRRSLSNGVVLGIVPFLGLYKSLINGTPTTLRCGSGLSSFNISTTGTIEVCPIAPNDFPEASVGRICDNFSADSVKNSVHVDEPCKSCDILGQCGGRCLYANKTKWWGEDGFLEVCKTVRHLIKEVEDSLDHVKDLIANESISEDILFYPKYNNSCEIIP